MAKHVSGFVSILGRPNVGKSTLLNALIGTKVAIVSDKPQTTRTSIRGIMNRPDAQVVFVDTPGIHRPDTMLNKKLAQEVAGALEGCDLLVLVVDCTRHVELEDERAVELIAHVSVPKFLVLNKIDRLKDKSRLLPKIERYRRLAEFSEYIPISALTGNGLDRVERAIIERLPEGPPLFPEDEITDQPTRFFVAEIIREKVLLITRQEVPHSVMVAIDSWDETDRLLKVASSIVVEREGQKAIVIGAGGSRLKEIGAAARLELEEALGKRLYIELFVKVRKGWREKPAFLRETDWKG